MLEKEWTDELKRIFTTREAKANVYILTPLDKNQVCFHWSGLINSRNPVPSTLKKDPRKEWEWKLFNLIIIFSMSYLKT